MYEWIIKKTIVERVHMHIGCFFNHDILTYTNKLTWFHQVHPDLKLSEKRNC